MAAVRRGGEVSPPGAGRAADVLAAAVAVTSFPAYDRLGPLADHPERAARMINHLVRSLTG
jgi:hypothetical protein